METRGNTIWAIWNPKYWIEEEWIEHCFFLTLGYRPEEIYKNLSKNTSRKILRSIWRKYPKRDETITDINGFVFLRKICIICCLEGSFQKAIPSIESFI